MQNLKMQIIIIIFRTNLYYYHSDHSKKFRHQNKFYPNKCLLFQYIRPVLFHI